MNAAFGRDALLDAFDQIGRAAVLAGTKLQIAAYGGSALMLASNFRFATYRATDHLEFGTFPRDGTPPGLVVSVPSGEYLLALKLKAARVMDPFLNREGGVDAPKYPR
jgi:hypothetical protein